jgi:putative ABC transport system permease protein
MAVNGFALGTLFRLPGQPGEEGMEAEMKIGDLNYLDFYNLKLISGRNFSENKFEFDEFIVNERTTQIVRLDCRRSYWQKTRY